MTQVMHVLSGHMRRARAGHRINSDMAAKSNLLELIGAQPQAEVASPPVEVQGSPCSSGVSPPGTAPFNVAYWPPSPQPPTAHER